MSMSRPVAPIPSTRTRLLKAIGREDLIGDPRYDTGPARGERAAEVDEIIAAWTRDHTKEEAMKLIGAAGVPAAPCSTRSNC